MSTTVWVLEDHENFATQIMRLINAEDDMECPHHFRSPDEMYEKLKFTKEHPDLLLLDLGLPRKSGLEVLSDLKTLMPDTKVLILSSFDEREKVYRAIERLEIVIPSLVVLENKEAAATNMAAQGF